jgi:hypothetical protein
MTRYVSKTKEKVTDHSATFKGACISNGTVTALIKLHSPMGKGWGKLNLLLIYLR